VDSFVLVRHTVWLQYIRYRQTTDRRQTERCRRDGYHTGKRL